MEYKHGLFDGFSDLFQNMDTVHDHLDTENHYKPPSVLQGNTKDLSLCIKICFSIVWLVTE